MGGFCGCWFCLLRVRRLVGCGELGIDGKIGSAVALACFVWLLWQEIAFSAVILVCRVVER